MARVLQNGQTTLQVAVQSAGESVIRALRRHGARWTDPDPQGNNAVHYVAQVPPHPPQHGLSPPHIISAPLRHRTKTPPSPCLPPYSVTTAPQRSPPYVPIQ